VIAGRYSLDREIGRGGMGAVWLGRDELLGRVVALKRLGLPGADDVDLARAEREARLTARLDHPHVVSVFNLVADPDTDTRWLVMEYVDGQTLAETVRRRGRLTPEEAAPLLRQAADALVAAHSAGIVHRDVKPSNILVDHDGRVKLSDFGIARIAGDATLTQTGLVTGSPAYLAPEVAAGRRGDASVDVWALGATTFFALSGRPPYDMGDHVLGGLYRIVNEEPPRLPDAGRLGPLLEGTMVKDPAQRWSMTEVRAFLARPAPVAAPSAAASPASGRSRRLPRALVAGLAAALALVLGLVLFLALDGPELRDDAGAAPSPSPETSSTTAKPEPTAAGMESFIRDYVAALSSDVDAAWQMLTPKFQRESGGLATYRDFWDGVGRGRVLSIDADPDDLVVSYRVRFENFGTGRRPTVLDLVFEDGRYRIDGERTEGFEPAQ
jgi:eukaryotic-like serine/threonine-protein kinase